MPAAQPFAPSTRHVQLFRALFAAVAAAMLTFSQDLSASVGLAVFGGWATVTAIVIALGAWTVQPRGSRLLPLLTALAYLIAGAAASIPALGHTLFFILIPAWALVAGGLELAQGIVQRRGGERVEARDTLTVAVLTLVLGVAVLIVPAGYALDYYIEEAGRTFTLTGEIIAVGIFGGYAAIVAVVLAIAGFSPRAAHNAAAQGDAEPAVQTGGTGLRIPEERP